MFGSKSKEKRVKELREELADLESDLESDDGEENSSSGGAGKFLLTLLAAAGGAAFFWRKKRERELDEALWEEPRSL